MKAGMIIIFLLLSFFLVGAPLASDTMRCGRKLVSTGDSKVKVLMTCGEPWMREVIGEKSYSQRTDQRYGNQSNYEDSTTVLVEKWTYYLGRNQFLRYLTFEGDTLVRIVVGEKPRNFE
jgi:hypothetical protein